MKNILNYYYSLYPENINYKDDIYSFSYEDNNYILEKFIRPISDIDSLYDLNKKMIERNILVHEIIINNFNSLITYINEEAFVLMKYYININKKINLSEICFINNNTINISCNDLLKRNNWVNLWEMKNDYFESQIVDINKKYPKLCNYANYYIGLAENASVYVKNALKIEGDTLMCISHKRIRKKDSVFSLYHPFNYIYDYRVRDVAEYIKDLFFSGMDVTGVIEEYFYYNYLSYKEILLFYARLLYPSYFFDLYDDVVNQKEEESKIENIILMQKKYEQFLIKIRSYLININGNNIPQIDWLI